MQYWIFVALVAMGTYAGYVYRQKGRSGVMGFLSGFFLGPVGIFLALFSSSAHPSCPYCTERINPRSRVCKYCGRVVKGKLVPPPDTRPGYRLVAALVTLVYIGTIAWLTQPFWMP